MDEPAEPDGATHMRDRSEEVADIAFRGFRFESGEQLRRKEGAVTRLLMHDGKNVGVPAGSENQSATLVTYASR